jgi:6-phospho-beta-glucosidase
MAGVKQTRGQVIHTLNKQYYEALSAPDTNPIDVYNRYIQQRDGSYMTQETGYARKEAPRFDILTHTGSWGYDAVAFNLVEALVDTNQGKQLIVNVANRGTLPYLTDSDVIETSCLCNNGQCHATEATTELPACAIDLIKQVKKFERLTIAAAGKRDRESQIAALEENPVVAKHLVPQIIDDLNKRFASIGSDDE